MAHTIMTWGSFRLTLESTNAGNLDEGWMHMRVETLALVISWLHADCMLCMGRERGAHASVYFLTACKACTTAGRHMCGGSPAEWRHEEGNGGPMARLRLGGTAARGRDNRGGCLGYLKISGQIIRIF
jgi:hypothetical protein